MKESEAVRRMRGFLEDERNSAMVYRRMAEAEDNSKLAEVYRRLAASEEAHAEAWAGKLREAGADVPPFRPSWRTKVYLWILRRFGAETLAPTLSSIEEGASKGYLAEGAEAEMASSERSHARLLRQIARGGMEGGALARFEGRHRSAGGNALRAAVLGAADGLLSNMSLVMGVSGAALDREAILITGLSGLLAGAISMSLGEWISVQSSRELYEKQLRTEAEEIREVPEEEAEELSLIYQARGLPEESARVLAARIMSDREGALETLAREELGIDPKELGGSAREAAIASFLLFAGGAIIPVIPFFFIGGSAGAILSILFSLGGLWLIGAAITLYTGRSALFSGLRQLAFGLAAAGTTFLIGKLLGVGLAG
jgi:VIT1/CCC1 family predicted Fe2+/Mn2+ transporter